MNKFWTIFLCLPFLFSCESKREAIRKRISDEQYETLMALSYDDFDQDLEGGWRQFHDDVALQILLVEDYMVRNNTQHSILKWHLGQLYGINNDYENAIKYFQQTLLEGHREHAARRAWNYYVKGSIAFMKRDEKMLDLYIDSLQNNEDIMNIEVLWRLKKNFNKPYREAY